jgi:F-type H+-transporting ATPase subunit epsilon
VRFKVLLPNKILLDEMAVKVIAEAADGSFCLKPRHRDFVAALVPGILCFTDAAGTEQYLAVDEGTLVKCGGDVLVSTRNAVRGTDLQSLRTTVEDEYLKITEAERVARNALSRLEAGIVRQYIEMQDGRR